MKKQHIIGSIIAMMAISLGIYLNKNQIGSKSTENAMNKKENGKNRGDESHPGQSINPDTNQSTPSIQTSSNAKTHESVNDQGASSLKPDEKKPENNCFRFSYQHQAKNQNRDIEDFLNDTNAFPIIHSNVNQKNICVRVNDKPVNFKYVKKSGKSEVIIGSIVGPESTILVSYCIDTVKCKESCVVKSKNKVDELLNDSELGGLENAELETQVKELRNVASVHGELMDSTIIRDWNNIESKEWVCQGSQK